jgi:hypothetical protein
MRSYVKYQEPFLQFDLFYVLENYFYLEFTYSKITFIVVNKKSKFLLLTYCYVNIFAFNYKIVLWFQGNI